MKLLSVIFLLAGIIMFGLHIWRNDAGEFKVYSSAQISYDGGQTWQQLNPIRKLQTREITREEFEAIKLRMKTEVK